MRGIVTIAGGKTYFVNAYVNCRLLRENDCMLPIEWFYLGDNDMPKAWREQVEKIPNVKLIDLGGTSKDNTKDKGGWQNKVNAVIQSSFEEILFLDADCFPVRDPEYLFDHKTFKEHSCILYPDVRIWKPEELISLRTRYGVPNLKMQQVESGQMLFKKSECMPGLLKCKELNDNLETYKYVYGDKDTFAIGMEQEKINYAINKYPCTGVLGGLVHYDFDGNKLFVHLTGGKWQSTARPFVRKDVFPDVEMAIGYIKELKW